MGFNLVGEYFLVALHLLSVEVCFLFRLLELGFEGFLPLFELLLQVFLMAILGLDLAFLHFAALLYLVVLLVELFKSRLALLKELV